MKKLLAVAIVFILSLSGIGPALAEGKASMPLTVGVTTRMSGAFFTSKWGINAADIDLRELIHGHNTISWERNGDYAIDETVVLDLDAFVDGKDKTFRISMNQNLAYSNGSPITAWDYAFCALLLSSAEFAALGGEPTELSWFKGYEAFRQGEAFSGVHVVDDYTLELTVDGRYLPYFYEIILLNLTPYPIAVLAPGCVVKDDGQGVYIDGTFTDAQEKLAAMREDGTLQYTDEAFLTGLMRKIEEGGPDAYPQGLFCEELLRETILSEASGYLFHPVIAAGPYVMESFDKEKQTARFVKNPHYAGNFQKVVPQIDQLTVVYADPSSALDRIENGTLDLVNKISDGGIIADGTQRMREERVRAVNYLRTGMNFISFACEEGPTQSANVRKAIAHCVDKNGVMTEFTQGFGQAVYGYYGTGQWMAQELQNELQAYETPLDLDEAIRLLEAEGWALNEEGQPYDREVGGVRWRSREDGTLEKLALKWAQPEETTMSALLEEAMLSNLKAVGVEAQIVRLPFEEVLAHYYRQTDREYQMMSLATNFNLAFDPYYTFHIADEFQGVSNKTGLADEQLMNLALSMRQTEVMDKEGYLEKWLKFQDRFCEMQPLVPLFSNVYFDFYRTDLQEYRSNAYFSWATAIVYAYIGEPPEEEPVVPVAVDLAEAGDGAAMAD